MSISLDGTSGINTPSISAGNIVGEVSFFAMDTPPTGWLKANGAEIDRTAYASLFNVIGTTYGAGDGSTTFNLPDLRGEFLRAWDDSAGVDAGRGFGSNQLDQLQQITGDYYSRGTHRFGDFDANGAFYRVQGEGRSYSSNNPDGVRIGFDSALVTRSGDETRPRNVALLACIKF